MCDDRQLRAIGGPFLQALGMAREMGARTLDTAALDGTNTHANATAKPTIRATRYSVSPGRTLPRRRRMRQLKTIAL